MLVKIIPVRKTELYSIICEADRYFGDIDVIDFQKCLIRDETVELYEETYWTVDKDKIIKYCVK